MITFILGLLVVGLIAGFLARAIVPGRDPMSVGQTVLLGVVGSFVGGFLGDLLFGRGRSADGLEPAGIIGSVIGSVIVLLVYRAVIGGRSRLRA